MPSTARTICLAPKTPPRTGKCLVSPSTLSSGSPLALDQFELCFGTVARSLMLAPRCAGTSLGYPDRGHILLVDFLAVPLREVARDEGGRLAASLQPQPPRCVAI